MFVTRRVGLAIAAALLAGSSVSAQADAPSGIDRQITVTPNGTTTWQGATATGTNLNYWELLPAGPLPTGTCSKDVRTYCEQILVRFDNPLTQAERDKGQTTKSRNASVVLDAFTPTSGPVTDFDLLVYDSDATGSVGAELASDGGSTNTTQEQVDFVVQTSVDAPSHWVLVRAVYFYVVNGSYRGTVTF